MKISEVSSRDLESVIDLVRRVAISNILPFFDEDGKENFMLRVSPDVKATFDASLFNSYKIVVDNEVVGFGAIRERNYITHLFIDLAHQRKGYGKLILLKLLENSKEVSLRASVNSVEFYRSSGFSEIAQEVKLNGIRFVHMRWLASS